MNNEINIKNILILVLAISFLGCNYQSKEENATWIPTSWIKNRVESAKDRMSKDSAGIKVWESIEAHGGLEKWFQNGALKFHFDYQPVDGGKRRNSKQVVDQWSVRSVHQSMTDVGVSYGWDGSQAWIFPDSADASINPRFWSNTPFYFVGLPFVLADEGVNYESLPSQELDGVSYDLIKITYQAGIGDAPDDFYIIYINQETKLMGALRYIVSYPAFFPNGGHSKEKIMKIQGLSDVQGIQFPIGYRTYWWEEAVGEHITNIDVKDVSFDPGIDSATFQMPDAARVLD